MKREVDDRTVLEKMAEEFARVLEKHAKYIIVSGFVAIAHGRSRGTEDIDFIIEKLGRLIHHDGLIEFFTFFQSDLNSLHGL